MVEKIKIRSRTNVLLLIFLSPVRTRKGSIYVSLRSIYYICNMLTVYNGLAII